MLHIGGLKTLLHVNGTLYYTLNMHIYPARIDVLKEILDGASKKRIGLCIGSRPIQSKSEPHK